MARLSEDSPAAAAADGRDAEAAAPCARSVSSEGERFRLLDGLRGFAAFLVLLWHYHHFYLPIGGAPELESYTLPIYWLFAPAYHGGYLAVQLFWVISGFVFFHVYLPRQAALRSFAANRIGRLYPLHLVTLVAVALLQLVALSRFGSSLIYEHNDWYHFVLNLFFASNWGFEEGYSFNAPIWSVSVEVLIYAFFWLALRHLRQYRMVLAALLVMAFWVASVVFSDSYVGDCGFFFFVGGVVYLLNRLLARRIMAGMGLALAVVAAGLAAVAIDFELATEVLVLALVFGGAVLLVSLLESYPPQILATASEKVGDLTYGMYLWHIPIQLVMILAIGRDIADWAPSPLFLAFFLASVIATAWAGFHMIERPANRWVRGLFHARARTGPQIAGP